MDKRIFTDIFNEQIESYFSSGEKFFSHLYWKGRVALYAILKALDIKEGDEIIIPAFTCVVVPNAIIYTGATPVYVDITYPAFEIDINQIEKKITPKTKAILSQNTFGLAPNVDAICFIAKKYSLFVIEDCAHGFGSKYKDRLCGTFGDAAFFSTQWNKTFSTGIGGIAITKNIELNKRLNELNKFTTTPSFKDKAILSSLIYFNQKFLNDFTYWYGLKTFRLFSKLNFMVGSNSDDEFEGTSTPDNYFKVMASIQAQKGIEELKQLNVNLAHRKSIAAVYNQLFNELNIEQPLYNSDAVHSYLKYSFFVRDRKRFLKLAESERIEFSDWFKSPIHPVQKSLDKWNYEYGQNTIAETISEHIVNLPTHKKIDVNYIDKLKPFLEKYRSQIFDSVSKLTF